jgi:hypothetical protein
MALFIAVAVLAAMVAGAAAQGQDTARQVEGFKYLYSTNLAKRQPGDVIRTFDSTAWDNGINPKGMHKCARLCHKEGGGGVCAAYSFCWSDRRCYLLSRLPASLEAAQPGALSALAGGSPYDPKCGSGFAQSALNSAKLSTECGAALQDNTLFADTDSLLATFRNRVLWNVQYDTNQKSAADCCALCGKLRGQGCTSWSYEPNGWVLDRSHKCTLRTGVNPTTTTVKGATSGVMN